MADSHPFANAGLGMFGSAEKAYANMGMAGGEKGGLTSKLGAALLSKTGIKDFLDNLGKDDTSKPVGVAPPVTAQSIYNIQPVAPMSPQGINPMRLPNAMPGGVGLNAAPAGMVAPKLPTLTPDDDHANQVLSSWG